MSNYFLNPYKFKILFLAISLALAGYSSAQQDSLATKEFFAIKTDLTYLLLNLRRDKKIASITVEKGLCISTKIKEGINSPVYT